MGTLGTFLTIVDLACVDHRVKGFQGETESDDTLRLRSFRDGFCGLVALADWALMLEPARQSGRARKSPKADNLHRT